MNSLYLQRKSCGIVSRNEDVERKTNSEAERIRELSRANAFDGFRIFYFMETQNKKARG